MSFFLAAGSFAVLRAWIYIGVYIAGSVLSAYLLITRVPDLANQRGEVKEGTKSWDKPIVFLYFLLAILIGYALGQGKPVYFSEPAGSVDLDAMAPAWFLSQNWKGFYLFKCGAWKGYK
ncbi:MAG: hypothetical protein ACLFR1_09895 [Spirochaetia bacterium]